jgi:hypothetical protein
MKVFISWSGAFSHEMAQAMAEWLPNVIQAVRPFLSSEDIQKGARWFEEIGTQLEKTNFGILCLTRDNIEAPWILFEAGALSKQLQLAHVVPLLIDVKASELKPPLSQFNAVVSLTQEEIAKLLRAMNKALGDARLSDTQFEKAFAREWPEFERRVSDVQKMAGRNTRAAPKRNLEEMIEEILELTRTLARRREVPEGSFVFPVTPADKEQDWIAWLESKPSRGNVTDLLEHLRGALKKKEEENKKPTP